MSLVKWKEWEKWLWLRAEDMAGSNEPVDKWNATHQVRADHPSKQWWELRMEAEGRGGGGRAERRRSIAWTIMGIVENIANRHNWVDLRDRGGRNVPIGWVAPTLHKKILPFSPNPQVTSTLERRWLLQEWAENSPPRTGMTNKICQITKYKRRKRRGRSEEVVNRFEKSILGKWRTT